MNIPRKFTESKLLVASGNPGKVTEIRELFSPHNVETISVSQFNLVEPEETGLTFADNAKLKAEYYGKATGLVALADDSGLSIEALDGFPGIYSARFAGPDRDFTKAFDLIESKLKEKGLNQSSAFFTSALCLYWPDGYVEQFEGKIYGKVKFPAAGIGYGYNPIFIPEGYDKSFAQLGSEEKNRISHRAIAFNQLIKACF